MIVVIMSSYATSAAATEHGLVAISSGGQLALQMPVAHVASGALVDDYGTKQKG